MVFGPEPILSVPTGFGPVQCGHSGRIWVGLVWVDPGYLGWLPGWFPPGANPGDTLDRPMNSLSAVMVQ